MKYLFVLITSLFVIACAGPKGDKGDVGQTGLQGTSGQNGTNGTDAPPTSFTPVALLNPCGDAVSVADEVLIQLANGQIVVSFSDAANGNNTRFAVLSPGNYVTTDGDHCYFTVSSTGELVNEHH